MVHPVYHFMFQFPRRMTICERGVIIAWRIRYMCVSCFLLEKDGPHYFVLAHPMISAQAADHFGVQLVQPTQYHVFSSWWCNKIINMLCRFNRRGHLCCRSSLGYFIPNLFTLQCVRSPLNLPPPLYIQVPTYVTTSPPYSEVPAFILFTLNINH